MDYILAGISIGGQYALIAIGYTMVYGILRLINFAHGDIFMAAGLIMVYASAELPLYASIPLVLVMTMLLGFAIERAAYKPLRTAPRMSVMISAIGVSYMLQNVALYATGGLAKTYPAIPWLSDPLTKLPTPKLNDPPPIASSPLYPSRNAILTVFIIGQTVNTSKSTIAGDR